jgi:signal transduction histidine kinase
LDEKHKFKAVTDKITDGIAICNPDYIIKESNLAILKYLNITNAVDINLIEILFNNFSVSMSKEKLMDLSIAHKKFDIFKEKSEKTEALYLEANLDLIKNSSQELLSVAFIVRDVTPNRSEEILKQETLMLMSHKLRTPLGLISGDIALLANGSYGVLNEEQKKTLQIIAQQTYLLTCVVEELLGFSIVCGHSSIK